MTEPHSAPGELEQTLGRLVEAGIAHPDDLAAMLGLESQHIRRPLRKLALAGVLESDPTGGLQLSLAGRTWLGVGLPNVDEPLVLAERLAAPRRLPPRLQVDEDRVPVAAEPEPASRAKPVPGWRPVWIASPRVRIALSRARMTMARVQLFLSGIRLEVAGVQLSASTSRRVAAVAASAAVLAMAMQVGLPAWGLAAVAPVFGARASHDDAPPLATAPAAAPVVTRTPVAAAPTERWVVVQHTDGLGLVLRQAPASTARVLTLQEGARVRVTGDPVQQAGRAWLPVVSLTGKTGWIAGEFVAPEP